MDHSSNSADFKTSINQRDKEKNNDFNESLYNQPIFLERQSSQVQLNVDDYYYPSTDKEEQVETEVSIIDLESKWNIRTSSGYRNDSEQSVINIDSVPNMPRSLSRSKSEVYFTTTNLEKFYTAISQQHPTVRQITEDSFDTNSKSSYANPRLPSQAANPLRLEAPRIMKNEDDLNSISSQADSHLIAMGHTIQQQSSMLPSSSSYPSKPETFFSQKPPNQFNSQAFYLKETEIPLFLENELPDISRHSSQTEVLSSPTEQLPSRTLDLSHEPAAQIPSTSAEQSPSRKKQPPHSTTNPRRTRTSPSNKKQSPNNSCCPSQIQIPFLDKTCYLPSFLSNAETPCSVDSSSPYRSFQTQYQSFLQKLLPFFPCLAPSSNAGDKDLNTKDLPRRRNKLVDEALNRYNYVMVYPYRKKAVSAKMQYLLSSLDKSGLKIKSVRGEKYNELVFVLLHIPTSVLLQEAENQRIPLSYMMEDEQPSMLHWLTKFFAKRKEIPKKEEQLIKNVTNAEKIMFLHQKLDRAKFGAKPEQYGVNEMIRQGIITTAYPLHDLDAQDENSEPSDKQQFLQWGTGEKSRMN
ncbi:hypothetical protein ILUMI_07746 [Ignelater luminosus]|uniref:Anoctamin dimerisation domain-containing protein n=1 Tax=Ignelater luminosus TaxID=2038154 RepID=A0A8K0D6W0_IGNLU|nr:hypothetical protein ILUMI_07746 [Ignelater luminosus]